MSDLVDFLLARIEEDEEMARDAAGWDKAGTERSTGCWHRVSYGSIDDEDGRIVVYSEGQPSREQADHIARWDPARVLAECDAKRRIVGTYLGSGAAMQRLTDPIQQALGEAMNLAHGDALKALALPYAGHPSYRQEWKP